MNSTYVQGEHQPRKIVSLRQSVPLADIPAPEGWWIVQVIDTRRDSTGCWTCLVLVEFGGSSS